jgi:HEAT repeat protein
VTEGLLATFQKLKTTPNEAAVKVLTSALDSPQPKVRALALEAILARRNPAGHRELIRRVHTLDDHVKGTLAEYYGRMTKALRDALLGNDRQLCVNACLAAVWFREYDLVPVLLKLLESAPPPAATLAGGTLLKLAEHLYNELASPPDDIRRRDPQAVRRRVVNDLEQSLARFSRHQRREVVEAFVLLVNRDNVTFKGVLHDPQHPAHAVLVEALGAGAAGGVIRLLLNFLDDPHAPSLAISLVSRRSDLRFVEHLLHKVGGEISPVVRQNLRRITSFPWLADSLAILDQLGDDQQHAAARLATVSGLPRARAYAIVEHLLTHGKVGGRRAAAEALAEFLGPAADALVVRSLTDADPEVQAHLLRQLRGRGIPTALATLVEMLDCPHAVVRQAGRESLSEYTFARYLASFDGLDEPSRRSMGMLVKKIDPETFPSLEAELSSQVRARRFKALAMLQAMEAVVPLEPSVIALLCDEDHLLRAAAATALGQAYSKASREALERAVSDRSTTVQEAAREGILAHGRLPTWREPLPIALDTPVPT